MVEVVDWFGWCWDAVLGICVYVCMRGHLYITEPPKNPKPLSSHTHLRGRGRGVGGGVVVEEPPELSAAGQLAIQVPV